MPELPDVETFRRYFEKTSLHQKISSIDVKAPRILEETTAENLDGTLRGHAFISSRRHGKVLFAETDSHTWLTFHFGMTGFFHYFRNPTEEPSHDRCLFNFENGGHLAYDNRRMIGRIGVTPSPDDYVRRHNLGPDAVSIDQETFRKRVSGKSGKIKQTLMDQEVVAGIGNEYADEILFQAKIHPERKVSALEDASWERLYRATREVLEVAVSSEADAEKMPQSFLLPHRMKKGVCPRCSTALRQLKVGGRTSYFCPACQDAP